MGRDEGREVNPSGEGHRGEGVTEAKAWRSMGWGEVVEVGERNEMNWPRRMSRVGGWRCVRRIGRGEDIEVNESG
jgi:hypothetical protein